MRGAIAVADAASARRRTCSSQRGSFETDGAASAAPAREAELASGDEKTRCRWLQSWGKGERSLT